VLSRQNARPGTPLSEVGGLPPIRGHATAAPAANSAPPAEAKLPAPTPQGEGTQGAGGTKGATPMALIIRPSARDRWLASLLAMYTPTYIENICRGAMAGNLISQWLMFDLMEQTWPRLQKNLKELKDAVNDLEWNLQPFALKGQKPTDEAQRRARIIEYIIWNMDPDVKKNENDFEDTVFDVLDALGKSISVLEMDIPPEPVTMDLGSGPESFFPIKATRWVHPRYYGYPNYPVTSDELMLNWKEVTFSNPQAQMPTGLVDAQTSNSIWVPFPEDKFIISVMKQKSGHPINSGMLRILGFFWSAQNFTWDWFLNYAQIFGQPLRWATYAQNAPQETITLVEQLLRDMGSSGYASFPEGTALNLLEAMKGGGENPQKVLIDAADTICDLVILNEAMSSEHGGAGGRAGGTQASATVGKGKRDEKIHAVAGSAAKCLNQQLIKPLCRLNFGDTNMCPYLEASAKQSKDSVAVATKYKTILSIPKVRVSQEQFYTDNDLVQPGPDDAVFEGQASGTAQGGPDDASGGGNNAGGDLNEGNVTGSAKAYRARAHAFPAGSDSQLVDHALADATGIAPRWLGAARPIFEELIAKAKSDTVTDADFIKAVAAAQKELPGVFDRLDHKALERVIEQTMAAGVVNGVVKGALARRPAKAGGAA
jgi:phage gp29-like protein